MKELLEWLKNEISKPNPPVNSGRDITKVYAFKIRRTVLNEVLGKVKEIMRDSA